MNVIDITITSVAEATHDDYNNVLVLRLGNGTSIRIEGNAFGAVREALPGGGEADVSDVSDAVERLREALESAQSDIQSYIESAQSNLSDLESNLESALSETGCGSNVGSALDDIESAVSDLRDNLNA